MSLNYSGSNGRRQTEAIDKLASAPFADEAPIGIAALGAAPRDAPPRAMLPAVPAEMKERPQWIVWEAVPDEDGKLQKIPMRAAGVGRASSTNSRTWSSFPEAAKAFQKGGGTLAGIGFVFTKDDPYVGIDFDDCLNPDGSIEPWATEWLDKLPGSYAEVSPSGTGIKVWCRGRLPGSGGRRAAQDDGSRAGIEVYDKGRYFCVTGRLWGVAPVDPLPDHQAVVEALHAWVKTRKPKADAKVKAPAAKGSTRLRLADRGLLSDYVAGAIQRECDSIAGEGEGGRNHALNRAAFNLGTMAGWPEMDQASARAALADAAERAGLRDGEIGPTINSGWSRGAESPRDRQAVLDKPNPRSAAARRPDGTADKPGDPDLFEALDLQHAKRVDPMLFGSEIMGDRWIRDDGQRVLVHHRGEWWLWSEPLNRYVPMSEDDIGRTIRLDVHRKVMEINAGIDGEKDKITASTHLISGVTHNVKALAREGTQADGTGWDSVDPPQWLVPHPPFPASETLSLRNATIHVGGAADGDPSSCLAPDPRFFSRFSLDFDFDPNPPRPDLWLQFLDETFPGDQESRDCLQETFGYMLTPDTSLQTFFAWIGKTGAGKGVCERVLESLIGPDSVAALAFESFKERFGTSTLPGKLLGVFADARLPRSPADQKKILSLLLSISAGDKVPIDRKNKAIVDMRLPTRILIVSNELPAIVDPSGAIMRRLVLLPFRGPKPAKPDPELSDRIIEAERPAILLWALEGWRRLREKREFTKPKSGSSLVRVIREASNPIGQFIEDMCEVGPALEIEKSRLFTAWQNWCESEGRDFPGTAAGFSRLIFSALPELEEKGSARIGGAYVGRRYVGVDLKQPY